MDTLSCVFNTKNERHNEFKPVFDQIEKGKIKIVYGGSKYKSELENAKSYFHYFNIFNILTQYKKARKVIKLDDNKVDQKQQELEKIIQHPDFNDQHIVAIIIVSGCRLVCSKNSKHYPFIKDKIFYPSKFGKISIYRGYNDKDMLLSRNVKRLCKRCREENR